MSVTSCYFLLLLPSADDRTGLTGTLLYRAICRRLQNQTFSFSKHFRRSVCVCITNTAVYISACITLLKRKEKREATAPTHTGGGSGFTTSAAATRYKKSGKELCRSSLTWPALAQSTSPPPPLSCPPLLLFLCASSERQQ